MKTSLTGLAALSLLFAGCTAKIGVDPELQGTHVQLPLAPGQTPVDFQIIRGDALKAGERYAFKDLNVSIIGDIPQGVSISGENGQLKIVGDIGPGVSIDVNVPYYKGLASDSCKIFACLKEFSIGAKPPFDQAAVISIYGDVDPGAKIHSPGFNEVRPF